METYLIAVLVVAVLVLAGALAVMARRRPAPPALDAAQVSQAVAAQLGQSVQTSLQQANAILLQTAETSFQTLRHAGAGDLEQKKGLIDQQLGEIRGSLERVSKIVAELEKDREQKFGQLDAQLKTVGAQTLRLTEVTGKLRETLANTRARGQWGERMAEDVLQLLGFKEGLNYRKQQTLESNRARPDFTFLLPKGFCLNMDVKFPLENYLKLAEASSPQEQEAARRAFLRDARQRLEEVVSRDYIDPQQQTVDCVLLFIPNEQIFQFIHEQDHKLLDDALAKKVVLCSPVTLFAVLLVIRQAVDNFSIQQTSDDMIKLMAQFERQWALFKDKLDDVGKRLDAAQSAYQQLTTTRESQLERPLGQIAALRRQRGLESPDEAAEPAVSTLPVGDN